MNNYSMFTGFISSVTVGVLTVLVCVSGFELWRMYEERIWMHRYWRRETLPVIYIFVLSCLVIVELLPISARGFM